MIFVDGVAVPCESSLTSSSSSSLEKQGSILLSVLVEHPVLVSASQSFKSLELRKVSSAECGSDSSDRSIKIRYVYLFQREYATVDSARVDFVGTDEATTCAAVIIRSRKSGMICLSHMDSPRVVDLGITQMLSLIMDKDIESDFDVHMVGAYEDFAKNRAGGHGQDEQSDSYSFNLCAKLVDSLQKRPEKYHIQTLFVLEHNTRWDAQGNAYPIFNGCVVETSTGSIFPACFDRTSRCPDELVRRIRVSTSFEDPDWEGKLLDTYDTHTDRFVIAPCRWSTRIIRIVMSLQHLSDEELLSVCSTSPSAEAPDFIENQKRVWDYLLKHRDWRETFPEKQPRVFERTSEGNWKSC